LYLTYRGTIQRNIDKFRKYSLFLGELKEKVELDEEKGVFQ